MITKQEKSMKELKGGSQLVDQSKELMDRALFLKIKICMDRHFGSAIHSFINKN